MDMFSMQPDMLRISTKETVQLDIGQTQNQKCEEGTGSTESKGVVWYEVLENFVKTLTCKWAETDITQTVKG